MHLSRPAVYTRAAVSGPAGRGAADIGRIIVQAAVGYKTAPSTQSVSAGPAQHAAGERASHVGALFGAGRHRRWRRGASEGEGAGGDDEKKILLGGTRWREVKERCGKLFFALSERCCMRAKCCSWVARSCRTAVNFVVCVWIVYRERVVDR
jgi:hypothetical protein